MSDFNAGRDINVGKNIHIQTETFHPKPLSICTNSELFNERVHRRALLSKERKRKFKLVGFLWVFAVLTISGFALYAYFISDNPNLSSLILGLGGISTLFYSIKLFEQPSEFETRQLAALKEIRLILRERNIE